MRRKTSRAVSVLIILILLAISNPPPLDYHRNYNLENYGIISITIPKSNDRNLNTQVGILYNWISLDLFTKFQDHPHCVNGIMLQKCLCYPSWQGRNCDKKMKGFKSLYDLSVRIVEKVNQIMNIDVKVPKGLVGSQFRKQRKNLEKRSVLLKTTARLVNLWCNVMDSIMETLRTQFTVIYDISQRFNEILITSMTSVRSSTEYGQLMLEFRSLIVDLTRDIYNTQIQSYSKTKSAFQLHYETFIPALKDLVDLASSSSKFMTEYKILSTLCSQQIFHFMMVFTIIDMILLFQTWVFLLWKFGQIFSNNFHWKMKRIATMTVYDVTDHHRYFTIIFLHFSNPFTYSFLCLISVQYVTLPKLYELLQLETFLIFLITSCVLNSIMILYLNSSVFCKFQNTYGTFNLLSTIISFMVAAEPLNWRLLIVHLFILLVFRSQTTLKSNFFSLYVGILFYMIIIQLPLLQDRLILLNDIVVEQIANFKGDIQELQSRWLTVGGLLSRSQEFAIKKLWG
ncbi:hypothetical protein BC833DRAFT_584136 [Globomyces pollinis-pini]|nr:hypothetical protein BC833DRAFT_584136 [Globomyces pollinis-pini]